MFPLLPALLSIAFAGPNHTAVRATFGDGQVLMGEVRTRTLVLATGSGVVNIPLADVGEVVPADGEGLGEARGRVTVWLRNGSELRGTWKDPTLDMRVRVGGENVGVDLPMGALSRFQLQGAPHWSSEPLFRLTTTWGDDILVDPTRTRLAIESPLGLFAPLLSECRAAYPLEEPDGPWRIELDSGTVLVGHLVDRSLTAALPMGPDEVSVSLAEVVSLERHTWTPVASHGTPSGHPYDGFGPADASPGHIVRHEAQPQQDARRESQSEAPAEWFDRAPMEQLKDHEPMM